MTVHLTHDCQIIETETHYITLTFKTNNSININNISFRSKFKQNLIHHPLVIIKSLSHIQKIIILMITKLNIIIMLFIQ